MNNALFGLMLLALGLNIILLCFNIYKLFVLLRDERRERE